MSETDSPDAEDSGRFRPAGVATIVASPQSHRRFGWLCLACALLASLPLFTKTFTIDWVNHTWMINYQARYLVNHLSFPPTLNTFQITGLPYPIFYGYLFFPFMALCSTVLDANLSVRIFAFALFAIQSLFAYFTLAKLTGDRGFAFAVATILIWAIYPLTNLYHRCALPEFFATGLLTCSCIAWIRAVCSHDTARLRKWCNLSVLGLCAAAGTHPITAIYGITFFCILVGLSLLLNPAHSLKKIAVALLIPACISALCLAPWVMAAGKYNRKLQIAQSFHVIGFYRLTIDNLPLRLSPIPIPYRFLAHDAEIEHMSTRHLDAEINVPMLIAFLAMFFALWKRRQLSRPTLIALSFMLFAAVLLTYFSVTNGFNRAGYMARSIQFFYRLVTYVNLCLFAGILLGAARTHLEGAQTAKPFASRQIIYGAMAISAIALAFKLGFTLYFRPLVSNYFAFQRPDRELLQLPKEFYGSLDYTMPGLVADVPDSAAPISQVQFIPAGGKHFGEPRSLSIAKATGWTVTNAQEFIWNRLSIDDVVVSGKQIAAKAAYLAVPNTAQRQRLSYEFVPDSLWQLGHRLSFPLFLLWLLATAITSLPRMKMQSLSGEAESGLLTRSGVMFL